VKQPEKAQLPAFASHLHVNALEGTVVESKAPATKIAMSERMEHSYRRKPLPYGVLIRPQAKAVIGVTKHASRSSDPRLDAKDGTYFGSKGGRSKVAENQRQGEELWESQDARCT
jgi:hypothetical protein